MAWPLPEAHRQRAPLGRCVCARARRGGTPCMSIHHTAPRRGVARPRPVAGGPAGWPPRWPQRHGPCTLPVPSLRPAPGMRLLLAACSRTGDARYLGHPFHVVLWSEFSTHDRSLMRRSQSPNLGRRAGPVVLSLATSFVLRDSRGKHWEAPQSAVLYVGARF